MNLALKNPAFLFSIKEYTEYQPSKTGMSFSYLNAILQYYVPDYFEGVHRMKNIPLRLAKKERYFIILYFDQHFVLLYVTPQYIIYMDSDVRELPTDQSCEYLQFIKFLKRCHINFPNRLFYINTKQLQGPRSFHCGFFCILFAIYLEKNCSFPLRFRNAADTNDNQCMKYIIRAIEQ